MINLIKYNLKIVENINYIAGWIFLLTIPVFVNFNLLNEAEFIKISEYVFTIIGLIWFTGLFSYEKKYNVSDIMKQVPNYRTIIFIVRITFILLSIFVGITFLLLFAKMQNAEFCFIKILYSSIVNSFVLGMVGLLFSQLVSQTIIGYMLGLFYYYCEILTEGKITKYLYLFGLIYNIPNNKLFLMILGIILLLINFALYKSNYFFKINIGKLNRI